MAELWERGTKGILEEEGGLRAFFDEDVRPAEAVGLVSGWDGLVREEADGPVYLDVADEWDPILAGERFFIAPPNSRSVIPEGRLWLQIHSPIAFGTGRHETTQLCLKAIEQAVKPGQTVADVGCGSGILSVAAELLGAMRIWSCDIHADAVDAARSILRTPAFMGSADALAEQSADVVIANISAKVLDRLAWDLKRIVKRDGVVIVSGFIGSNVPQCFVPVEKFELQDWQCWICTPDGIKPKMDGSSDLLQEADWWL